MFLLDAGEFYPFGSCVDKNNQLRPVGVYVDDEYPSALTVLSILEKNVKKGVEEGNYKIAAIALEVTIKENDVVYDAIEIRVFEDGVKDYKEYLGYHTYGTHIEFFQLNPSF